MTQTQYEEKCQQLFNKAKELGVELDFNPEQFDCNRLNCTWYGGYIANIDTHIDNIIITIECAGDIRATLFNENKTEDICFVKDKGNNGRFYDEMSHYIANDEELAKYVENGRLIFDNNNWIEYDGMIIKDESKSEYEIVTLLFNNITDDDNILNAIEEVLIGYREIVQEIKEEKGDIKHE